ncbi:hypothetical protein DLAC_00586 [Tieghemostelium lacteum]|uniref:WD40 repeat-containing protein n=1 Tax=Tieghemostelium lacteum TaxID=361077 RepID=A0A152AA66_TIELA|nr:hypothetical protein DLAC_00586 [Tieghemostelium lacteum]|eukprot:KYR03094.1 hypothetical protein DLAC_00586 [Tieghemostelium lacteum]
MEKKNYNNVTTSSDKNSIEALQKEIKSLKTKLDTYEKENKGLMKSIYDLTARYDVLVHQLGRSGQNRPFNIDALLAPQTPEMTSGQNPGIQVIGGQQLLSGQVGASTVGLPNINGSIVEQQPQSIGLPVVDTSHHHINVTSRSGTTGKKIDERHFFHKFTLKGHQSSVYTCKFSPCGKYLASGSFDKSVKVWDVYNQSNLATFHEHNVNVSELAWNNASTEILSGSYDKSVKLWDLQSNKLISSHNTSGFVLDVMFSPGDDNIFFAGNTQNHLIGFDKRLPNSIFVLENDSLINAIHIFKDGKHILTGDQLGKLKLWDSRKAAKTSLPESFHYEGGVDGFMGTYPNSSQACIESFEITTENRPISCITFSRNTSGNHEEDGRYLGVNCYDNVLRVYDRSKVSIVQSHPYSLSPMNLSHSLTGHKNKNWPIKSSIFIGKHFDNNSVGSQNLNPSLSTMIKSNGEELSTKAEEDDDEDLTTENINQSVLLATGSADYNAYIYDIGYSKHSSGKLLQKLEGHTDKVFSARFHPSEPILATSSADSTIRLWTPKKKIFNT